MNDRWRIVARVRDLRARLASNEAAQHRQAQARPEATLEQTRRLQAHYERLAAQASSLAGSLHDVDRGEARFSASEAQILLAYAVAARRRAQEAMVPIRRAQLSCQRARAAADEAAEKCRRALVRREAVDSQWRESARAAERSKLERADEALAEDRSSNPRAATGGSP